MTIRRPLLPITLALLLMPLAALSDTTIVKQQQQWKVEEGERWKVEEGESVKGRYRWEAGKHSGYANSKSDAIKAAKKAAASLR